MKTLLKIMRSIVTSLLFIFMTSLIIASLVFMTIRKNHNLSNGIDKNELLELVMKEEIEDENVENIAIEYIDDYLNYIFHRRSYPSVQNVNFSSLDESNLEYGRATVSSLKTKLDLKYDKVLKLRNINDLTSNGSIYILILFGIFVTFLMISIVSLNFKKGAFLSLISIIASSAVLLISSLFIKPILEVTTSPLMYKYITSMFNKTFVDQLRIYSIMLLLLGSLILVGPFLYKKYIHKKIS